MGARLWDNVALPRYFGRLIAHARFRDENRYDGQNAYDDVHGEV